MVDVVELDGVVLDVVDVDGGAGVIVVVVDVEADGRTLEGVICTVAGT